MHGQTHGFHNPRLEGSTDVTQDAVPTDEAKKYVSSKRLCGSGPLSAKHSTESYDVEFEDTE